MHALTRYRYYRLVKYAPARACATCAFIALLSGVGGKSVKNKQDRVLRYYPHIFYTELFSLLVNIVVVKKQAKILRMCVRCVSTFGGYKQS